MKGRTKTEAHKRMLEVKKIFVAFLICAFTVLTGCSAGDKSDFIEWMYALDAERTEIFFWSQPIGANPGGETELSLKEEQKLLSILDGVNKENLTWNKQLAGVTPEYGFRLIVGGDDYYINQAGAPRGQTEIAFRGKQWWIESKDLHDFMLSFLTVSK